MMSRIGYSLLLLFLVCGLRAAGGAEDGGGAKPQAPDVDANIRRAFTQLADSDASVRDAARAELMGIDRKHLPGLRKLVEENRPLLPSQAVVLRQIVTQVYLAGEPYDSNPNFGFLGVRMNPTAVSQPPAGQGGDGEIVVDGDGDLALVPGAMPQTGVVIVSRLPGFVGAKSLLEGDVILAIADQPKVQFGTGSEFTQAVKDTPAGQTIEFVILRRGRLMKVPIVLDPRPVAAEVFDQAAMENLDRERREKANEYWRTSFAPLVEESVG